ncbi:DUF6124 family protein [Pseudomonas sp. B1(2018)]|uniref:DUF6124 family protein n=1 Tax=Pseudomonas sp. B1(2018) TaxID=2233856 RepID=UPI003531FC87
MPALLPQPPNLCRSCRRLRFFDLDLQPFQLRQKIAAFGSSYRVFVRVYRYETLASVVHLEGSSRNVLLGISSSVMLAQIRANRMLDQIEQPA